MALGAVGLSRTAGGSVRLTPILGVMVLSMMGTPLAAQDEAPRRGLWLGAGIGSGWNISRGLDNETRPGFSGYLRFGGTLHPNVRLGFETEGWGRRDDDLVVMRGNVTASALLYPSRTGGLFIKPGLGFSSLRTTLHLGDGRHFTDIEMGFGGTLGIGYDLRLGKVPLTLGADWLFQSFNVPEVVATTNTILLFTVGVLLD